MHHVRDGQREEGAPTDVAPNDINPIRENPMADESGNTFAAIATDLRHAWRGLRRRTAFLAVAVTSVALAIALNCTMYSEVETVVAPITNFDAVKNLASIQLHMNRHSKVGADSVWQEVASALRDEAGVSGYTPGRALDASYRNAVATLQICTARNDFFRLLGVKPVAGRFFTPSDENATPRPIILSDLAVRRLFAGQDPLGKQLKVGEATFQVIGVTPSERGSVLRVDGWVLPESDELASFPLNVVRMYSPIELDLIKSKLGAIASRLAAYPGSENSWFDLRQWGVPVGTVKPFHFALGAAVLAILLVACANLGSLQLARGLSRTSELATRIALGASRARLVRLLVAEAAIISGLGLALSSVFTFWGIRILTAAIPAEIAEFVVRPQVTWRLFVVAATAAVLSTLLTGLFPAFRISRVDPNECLKSAAGTGAHRQHVRVYGGLVAVQIAFSLALLCAASALIRSAMLARNRAYIIGSTFGYDPLPLVSVLTVQNFSAPVSIGDQAARIQSSIRTIPAVVAATFIGHDITDHHTISVTSGGTAQREVVTGPLWGATVISPSYFATFDLPIVRGRGFVEAEFDPGTVIVDSLTAEYLWPHQSPIGQQIKFGAAVARGRWATVVGVVGDRRDRKKYGEDPMRPGPSLGSVFRVVGPQDSTALKANGRAPLSMEFAVRVNGAPARAAASIRRLLTSQGGQKGLNVETYDERYYITSNAERNAFVSKLYSLFGAAALCLAVIGVYGLVAHSVTERKRELAVRLALGGSTRSLIAVFLRQGNLLALIGVAGGLLITKLTLRSVARFLDDSALYGAGMFALIAAAWFATIAFAAILPVLRGCRIELSSALKND